MNDGPPRIASENLNLDSKSKRIIEELQHDGRRTYSEIGKAVGLSEAAVRQRVAKLIDSGAMQIVAVTDPRQLGFARQAMIGVRVTGAITPVADVIAELPTADYVVVTAGVYDILAEVVCADDSELLDVLNTIRAIPGVRETETMTYLDLRNQKYNWGTR
ncbi:Lrp/AsnC family transcriptional regulator [Corynebacterium glyciniphilum]|uniref:Lrp/AsnC family transcriptional regulator n=1 Tax=Corynebacterium glyciniphilum TaxID=1404244 RepID=UPI00235403CA